MALEFNEIVKHNLNKHRDTYTKEHINLTDYAHLYGAASSTGLPQAPILCYNNTEAQGNTIQITINQNFNDRVIIHGPNEYNSGKEGQLTYDSMQFSVSKIRWLDMIKDRKYTELVQNLPTLMEDLKAGLKKQAEYLIIKRICQAFGHSFYFNSRMGVINDNNSYEINRDYTYDEIAAKMLTVTFNTVNANNDAISTDRIVFGSNDIVAADGATLDAKLRLATSGIGNGGEEGLSVNFIKKMTKLARKGCRKANGNLFENKIIPYKTQADVQGFNGNYYYLIMGENSFEYLSKTADWKSQTVRGVIENPHQPSILFGSRYKGCIDGAMILVDENLDNYNIKCSDGAGANANHNAGFCVLLGMGALAYGMVGTPELSHRYDEQDKFFSLQHEEISGFMPIKFSSKLNPLLKGNQKNPLKVEVGMMYGFASIGA